MKKTDLKLNTIFAVAEEMIKNNGEDSYYFSARESDLIVASFDGCGGSGAKKYNNYSGKTGAFIASRAVCGAVKDWYEDSKADSEIVDYITRGLQICTNFADPAGRILGSLGKSFPTTAAITKAFAQGDKLNVTCLWAGDSRCYMLNSMGLHQLSVDDLDTVDAMSNLTDDGVMTNVINASTPFEIRCKKYLFDKPCILLTATDGCFGYLTSPMAFEYLLTNSLINSSNISEWKKSINESIGEVAGDDYTLCVAVCGYESFNGLKAAFAERNAFVGKEYLAPEKDPRMLWEYYKKEYNKYLQ